MIRISNHASDEQILEAVSAWIELLAQENYLEAFQLVRHVPNVHWSPELIRTVITNYGSLEPSENGVTFKVTSLKDNPEGQAFHEVEWWEHDPNKPVKCVGMVLFTLPLNGKWSDLTVSFDIVEEAGELALELDDIHVF